MKKFIVSLIFLMGCLSACTKQDRDNMIIDQEKNIDTYISTFLNQNTEYRVVRNGGSNRVVIAEGTGEDIVSGDSVIFRYAGYVFSNGKGTMFATNHLDLAEETDFQVDSALERRVVGEAGLLAGLNNGLIGAKQGEVCNIIFSANYGYGNTVVYNVPKLSPLFFEIWIDRVVKN